MAGDAEQTDSSGKYTFGGGAAVAKKYWPTIFKSIELVSCEKKILIFQIKGNLILLCEKIGIHEVE